MSYRANQDGQVRVENSDKYGPMKKGIANHFSILALGTHEQYERQKVSAFNAKLQ